MDRPNMDRPSVDRPYSSGMGYDNSMNSNFGGDSFGAPRPISPASSSSRCDEDNSFKQIGSRQRVRRQYVRRVIPAQSLLHCQRECVEAKDFLCRSFNYRDTGMTLKLFANIEHLLANKCS